MKTIKYIVIAVMIFTTSFGSLSGLLGQEVLQFSETYKCKEVINMIDQEDPFFTLINTKEAHPENAVLGSCRETDAEKVCNYLHEKEFLNQLPEDLHFAWGWDSSDGTLQLFALKRTKISSPGKEDIQSVSMRESSREGSWNLMITFSKKGAERFEHLTRENIGREIAIVVDGKVVSAPRVRMEIKEGKCLISGNLSKEEVSEIKTLLGH